jgi:hypothetical protein
MDYLNPSKHIAALKGFFIECNDSENCLKSKRATTPLFQLIQQLLIHKHHQGTPNIDVFSNSSITENKKAGTLAISGSFTGDNFPSTEAFISDPKGQNIFIGVGQIDSRVDKNFGPFQKLPFENEDNPITTFDFTITTDQNGNFTGVKSKDKIYTIEAWNNLFKNPQKD